VGEKRTRKPAYQAIGEKAGTFGVFAWEEEEINPSLGYTMR
jgi:hypothetical protein